MTWHALAVPTCAPSSTARFVQALELDDPVRHQRIAVMRIPQRGLGVTINERRTRAVRNAHASESQTSHDLACTCSPDMRSIINCSFRSSSSRTGRFCTSSALGHTDSPRGLGVATNERRTRAVRNAHASESQTSHDLACACSRHALIHHKRSVFGGTTYLLRLSQENLVWLKPCHQTQPYGAPSFNFTVVDPVDPCTKHPSYHGLDSKSINHTG